MVMRRTPGGGVRIRWVSVPPTHTAIRGGSCLGAPRTALAKFHAAIEYSRTPGNTDVDVDPLVTTSTQSLTSAPATIACTIR